MPPTRRIATFCAALVSVLAVSMVSVAPTADAAAGGVATMRDRVCC